jgi:hypothetical protein
MARTPAERIRQEMTEQDFVGLLDGYRGAKIMLHLISRIQSPRKSEPPFHGGDTIYACKQGGCIEAVALLNKLDKLA